MEFLTSDYLIDFLFPILLVALKGLLFTIAVIFFFSGIDDLFIDFFYFFRTLYRKIFVVPKINPLTREQLIERKEQPLAVLIPAWDESAVIRTMLQNLLTTIRYDNLHIFVGTYPNDPDTGREVDSLQEYYDNIHRVVCPDDGPTNKSDCLNWVYQFIRMFEEDNDIQFEVFVMHDSEDVVHPLSFKLYNYLIPRKDMVQLPVFPLERPWYDFTGGHYMDEFAEVHYKDLIVRESLAKHVPCAGVGCGFSKKAFQSTAEKYKNFIFDMDSLTEDYDFSFRLKKSGLNIIFVRQAFDLITTKKSRFTGRHKEVTIKEFIATREYFPNRFRDAVRQKARWVIGITFQGMAKLHWSWNPAMFYFMFRDRKAVITNMVGALSYFVLLSILAVWLFARFVLPESYIYPPMIEEGTLFWYLVVADTLIMVTRFGFRVFCVSEIYGLGQATLSIPRLLWANVINFFALLRAYRLYTGHLVFGTPLKWCKTSHVFPDQSVLRAFKRRLGDLFVEKRLISSEQLGEALKRQEKFHVPLGKVLLDMKLVSEDDLTFTLGAQYHLEVKVLDPYDIPLEVLRILPRELARKHSIFPLSLEDDTLTIVTDFPLTQETIKEVEEKTDKNIQLYLCRLSDLAFAIKHGYSRLEQEESDEKKVRLGQALVDDGIITQEQLTECMKIQRQSYVRLGTLLVEERLVEYSKLEELHQQYMDSDSQIAFGEFLVKNTVITTEKLHSILEKQNSQKRLGEILIEKDYVTFQTLCGYLSSSDDQNEEDS